MSSIKVGIVIFPGSNCDHDAYYVFKELLQCDTKFLWHKEGSIGDSDIIILPGGFSYGDYLRAGAIARFSPIMKDVVRFANNGGLVIGICNGFQVMVNLGIVPGLQQPIGTTEVSLEHNASFRFQCRWVDLTINTHSNCVFTRGINRLHIPVAHGEGNFIAPQQVIEQLSNNKQITMQYIRPDGSLANGKFPYNPNGSMLDIAAISDTTGRIMGMMPHPERHIFFMQRDDWTYLKELAKRENKEIPEYGEGLQIFKNAVQYYN